MTSLSQYLRSEQPDRSEPVTFYVPGAHSWSDPRLNVLRARRAVVAEEPEIHLVQHEENEDETL